MTKPPTERPDWMADEDDLMKAYYAFAGRADDHRFRCLHQILYAKGRIAELERLLAFTNGHGSGGSTTAVYVALRIATIKDEIVHLTNEMNKPWKPTKADLEEHNGL